MAPPAAAPRLRRASRLHLTPATYHRRAAARDRAVGRHLPAAARDPVTVGRHLPAAARGPSAAAPPPHSAGPASTSPVAQFNLAGQRRPPCRLDSNPTREPARPTSSTRLGYYQDHHLPGRCGMWLPSTSTPARHICRCKKVGCSDMFVQFHRSFNIGKKSFLLQNASTP